LNDFLISFFDFLLPRLCYGCGINLKPSDNLFCPDCFTIAPKVSPPLLEREFKRKFAAEGIISGFTSLFVFEEGGAIQKCIHEMKYSNSFISGKYLGIITARALADEINSWNCGLIIPVPIHRTRRADRGYNQSVYIAKGIGKALNIPVDARLLKRNRYTSTQTKLNLAERKINVSNAFTIKKRETIAGKRIILLDDVITTGATITECGKVLLDNGADKVFALSVALAE